MDYERTKTTLYIDENTGFIFEADEENLDGIVRILPVFCDSDYSDENCIVDTTKGNTENSLVKTDAICEDDFGN